MNRVPQVFFIFSSFCLLTAPGYSQTLKDSLGLTLNDTLAEWTHVTLDPNAQIFDRDDCDIEPISGGCPQAKFPQEAIERKLQGEVVVKILVTANNEIKRAHIFKTTDKVFNKASLQAAIRGTSFKAGVKDGKPINAWTYYPFKYRLNKSQ